MKTHESAENYLETILTLGQRQGRVRSIDVANELGFSKPSVSVAMKTLRERGYVTVDGTGNLALTEKGQATAAAVYEKHTLLSAWLVHLGVSKEVADADACRIEHVISEESFEAIKRHTGGVNREKPHQ